MTKEIAHAAHIFQCFERWRAQEILEEDGISHDDIRRGAIMADFEREERLFHRETFGAREYGNRIIDEDKAMRLRMRRDMLLGRLERGGSDLEREVWTEMLAENTTSEEERNGAHQG